MPNVRKYYKNQHQVEESLKGLFYYKLQNEMLEFIEGHYTWDNNSPFADVPGNFNSDAISVWINHLLDNGRDVLRVAHGLSIIHNCSNVQEEHIREAIEALKKGLVKHIADYTSEGDKNE